MTVPLAPRMDTRLTIGLALVSTTFRYRPYPIGSMYMAYVPTFGLNLW